ncbi:glycoside hydrolase family 16 protein [Aspergillus alliaceus]|uniref:glycoside hydrolase family 16 protein n=1 Tax=Petromyces alliaceus TaxID=209559 RepID=UPI0012A5303A|nr:concanavalin A-like lectin/glucanase domain-containing protein [Aspergillus alliaceus]KAB8234429.1 concanavalin A-like lectin/glucanase domain-containing protein [Aspergillus alliaceus]
MKPNYLTPRLTFSLILPTVTTSPTPTNKGALCDCYIVSGPEPGYFTNHHFWDFRNIPLPNLDQPTQNQNPLSQNATLRLTQTPFITDWFPQTWAKTGTQEYLPITNAQSNVFFARNPTPQQPQNPTYLLLQATRLPTYVSTAEIELRARNIFHCSLRVRMRLMSRETVLGEATTTNARQHPQAEKDIAQDKHSTKSHRPKQYQHPADQNTVPKGACVGLFTYQSKTCESDIEILTADPPNVIHYSNQPDYDPVSDTAIPGAGSIVNLSVPWTGWVTHRLDWFPGLSRWYADQGLQVVKGYGVPGMASTVVLNLWSDGGDWTGDLRVGESVFLGVEWIEMAFNVSSSAVGGSGRDDGGLGRARARSARRVGLGDGDRVVEGAGLGDKILSGIPKQEDVARGVVRCRKACYLSDFH